MPRVCALLLALAGGPGCRSRAGRAAAGRGGDRLTAAAGLCTPAPSHASPCPRRPARPPADIIGGAVVARDGHFINGLMDLHLGPFMLLGARAGWGVHASRGGHTISTDGTLPGRRRRPAAARPPVRAHRPRLRLCPAAPDSTPAGPTMDPKVASELSLRIPHLALRVREHSARALCFAQRLQALGAQVSYPGLPCHPQHALLRRLANPGGCARHGPGRMPVRCWPRRTCAACAAALPHWPIAPSGRSRRLWLRRHAGSGAAQPAAGQAVHGAPAEQAPVWSHGGRWARALCMLSPGSLPPASGRVAHMGKRLQLGCLRRLDPHTTGGTSSACRPSPWAIARRS